MDFDSILSCRGSFETIANNIAEIAKRYYAENDEMKTSFGSFLSLMKTRFSDFNPKITVYGIYNAGKSTLINALIGRDQAPVADVPTTDKITPYKWREYTLYDTPGINAPPQHEKLSKKHLMESDIIIFVLDTAGAFNFGKNYRELIDIIENRKRIILVLNNKSGYDLQTSEGQQELAKIIEHIYGDITELAVAPLKSDIRNKFKLMVVNAQDAFKARCSPEWSDKKKQILLNASNIQELENTIVEEYAQANGFSILQQLEKVLLDNIQMLHVHLQAVMKTAQATDTDKAIHSLRKTQEKLINKCIDEIHRLSGDVEQQVYSVLTQSDNQTVVENNIHSIINRWWEQVQEYANREIQQLQRTIASASTKSNAVSTYTGKSPQSSRGNVGLAVDGISQSQVLTPEIVDDSYPSRPSCSSTDQQPKSKMVTALESGAITAIGARAMLPALRALSVFGAGLAGIVSKFIPIIIPFTIALSLFRQSQREKEDEARFQEATLRMQQQLQMQQEIVMRQQEMREKAKGLTGQVENEIVNAVRQVANDYFESFYQEANAVAKQHSTQVEKIQSDTGALAQLSTDLKMLMHRYCD